VARRGGPGLTRAGRGNVRGLIVKLLLLALINAGALLLLPAMIDEEKWAFVAFTVISTVALNVIYLTKRAIPLKYLAPATVFLIAFQVYPVVYTGYIAFTNYSTGHVLNKDDVIERLETQRLFTPEGAVRYRSVPMTRGDEFALLLTDPDGRQFLGTSEGLTPIEEAGAVQGSGTSIQAVGDYRRLPLGEANARQEELLAFRVPTEQGEVQLESLSAAAVKQPLLDYDPDTDTVTNRQTGVTYTPREGQFVSADGQGLDPGWRVLTGTENFTRAFTTESIRGPFVRVFAWTYAFAILSVVLPFAFGLLLAVTLNDKRMRTRGIYRVLLIVPYALPSFLTALIWAGMLNQDFGVINRLIGSNIGWLNDPWLVKLSIVVVNTWLGVPYMFIVITGALQAMPDELLEAAKVDGARPLSAFRLVTFPLLLVALAPLLIASFAFNFNNFNTIYLLARGGPPIEGAETPAGHSDILITYVYRLAFEGGRGQEFAFAAAIAMLIFVMVAAISYLGFRRTRALEEVNA
jgi:arabinogalactan oligomer/maltooligosaccharide transport system permease protein